MSDVMWPQITKDTTLQEIKRIHQQIWDYVIEHGEKPNTPYKYNCVCCEYVLANNVGGCNGCPIRWHDKGYYAFDNWCINGLYGLFIYSNDVDIAKRIRDIKFIFEENDNGRGEADERSNS